MESIPLLPKTKELPNLNAAPLIRELFQEELQLEVPSKKLSENIITSLQFEKLKFNEEETYRSFEFLENLTKRKDTLYFFSENIYEAYTDHEKKLNEIKEAEKNIFEAQANHLRREETILQDKTIQDFLKLKRQPIFQALDLNYVKKFKLLQGEASLPPQYEAKSDFRVKNFKKWRKKLENLTEDEILSTYLDKLSKHICNQNRLCPKGFQLKSKKNPKLRGEIAVTDTKRREIFRAEPKMVLFSNYRIGEMYEAEISLRNVFSKGLKFRIQPTNPSGPFKVMIGDEYSVKINPGLTVKIFVEFTPKSLDYVSEDIIVVIEDGHRLLIPMISYLEPPILKTHPDINEFTTWMSDKIISSYIECGICFPGDSSVTKLRFGCYRGAGEFFIMSYENWNKCHVNSVTLENMLEIPPFRVYPVYFKMEKNEVIDLFVEFFPKYSGTHVENIVVACNNGEVRSLDLLGDSVAWHGYYFTFQDALLKQLPVDEEDDMRAKYYVDFEDVRQTGSAEKAFYVSNNSNMPFEFQWKLRDANIYNSQDKYLKLTKYQVKITPENGTFEPNSVWEFVVTVTFDDAEIGHYRAVLSLYVLNLPYQCIEEDTTIIQPTGLVKNLYSQSLFDEEEGIGATSELQSLQGTYESLQESIKSYVECQSRAQAVPKSDFCRTTCIPNPGLCAKPLKKSKTYFNIGDNIDDEGTSCVCRSRQFEGESRSESCHSNTKEKISESSAPRNEVIWDFVDILVDEIELWAEVTPVKVTIEPCILEFCTPISIKSPTVYKKVCVTNHNRTPITCEWILLEDRDSDNESADEAPYLFIFDNVYDEETRNRARKYTRRYSELTKQEHDEIIGEKVQRSNTLKSSTEINLDVKETKKVPKTIKKCLITTQPRNKFTVSALSKYNCSIGISANRTGNIKEKLNLVVNNDDLILTIEIYANAVANYFRTSPDVLDFGILKKGTRSVKDCKITSENDSSIEWRINQFMFDFAEEKFLYGQDAEIGGNLKNEQGILLHKDSSEENSYCLNGRICGIRLSLLEIESVKPKLEKSSNRYILVLGDVRIPSLRLSTSRFENAILAPAGVMYIGQETTNKVSLINTGSVETYFNWGNPFGCHSRKIKIDIVPRHFRIQKGMKLPITVTLTPLDEGIISHCYIPCFFCRSSTPLILSVVGVVEKINVTFEIIDYPKQTHKDTSTFLKTPYHHTVLRIPWPIKVYNSTLGMKFVTQEDVTNLKCKCSEVEEEARLAFDEAKNNKVEQPTAPVTEENTKTKNSEAGDDTNKIPKKLNIEGVGHPLEEEVKASARTELSEAEKLTSKVNSIKKYVSRVSSIDTIHLMKSQLEFWNVPYRVPVSRQFVIRNETPVPITFKAKVCYFDVTKKDDTLKRIELVKNRILDHNCDNYKHLLPKEQPLIIVVEPSSGELLGNDAVCINVVVYGNTWGEYRDYILCEIKGLENFYLKLFIQIVGHPIIFPMFCRQSETRSVVRFEPVTPVSSPTTKKVKVVNRSAISIIIYWIVFLTEPLTKEEEQEICSTSNGEDSNPNLDSNHSITSSKSALEYLSKNASETMTTIRNMMESMDTSQSSGNNYLKTEMILYGSSRDFGDAEKGFVIPFCNEELRSEIQQYPFSGQLDHFVFQVEPKQMIFEPFEEKKLSVTFHPQIGRQFGKCQDFRAVLTGCVRLKPEDEKCAGVYYRPCGMNFVSEILDFSATIETPLLSFDLIKGDLKFIVNANSILKAPDKKTTISRKYMIRNRNHEEITLSIDILPGLIFNVKNVQTMDKIYYKFNSEAHTITIEPGQVIEMEIECAVSGKTVMYAYEQLKLNRKKDRLCSNEMKLYNQTNAFSTENRKDDSEYEPWCHFFKNSFTKLNTRSKKKPLTHRDSLQINLNRMSSSKSEFSVCDDLNEKNCFGECAGELMESPCIQEITCQPNFTLHTTTIKEQISFTQTNLLTQNLELSLIIHFPLIRITPMCLDFGNIFVNESSVRFCSLVNLTGFPTEFTVKPRFFDFTFDVKPLTGSLPATNYTTDIGTTLMIEFKPQRPGYFQEVLQIFCNADMEFDSYELFLSGMGTWNEKYKSPKVELATKLKGAYAF